MRKTANPPRSNYRCRATDQSSQSAGVKGSDPFIFTVQRLVRHFVFTLVEVLFDTSDP
jgi:hypothetical protein